ncbi:MAG TPA: hypothetical protein VGL20_21500 [Candidatus Dormibacteraeota bacterium]|jgi:hypothetical protein
MRGAPLAAVTVLVLFGAACGGGPSTAQSSPPPSTGTSSTTSRSTTASVSFGTPVPATPTTRVTARPTTSATLAARTPAPTCTPGEVGISTTTDLPRYAAGAAVTVKVVVRNLSAGGCLFNAAGDFAIEPDPSGAAVYAVHLGCPADGCQPLAPRGGTLTYPVPWDQKGNEDPYKLQQVPPGQYHAKASFPGYPVSASAPFTITP